MSPSQRRFTHHQDAGDIHTLDPHHELLQCLSRISTYNPPVRTGWGSNNGFYSGPTSIAYLFYRLSLIYPDLQFEQRSLFDWADSYLGLGSLPSAGEGAPDSDHCGIANGTLASLTLRSIMRNDQDLAHVLCEHAETINDAEEEGSNEWLYGRAGYLYFLRLCRSHFETRHRSQALTTKLTQAIESTVRRIMESPLPWTWHGKEYVGAAHGSMGIITQIVLSCTPGKHPPALDDVVRKLIEMQLPTGNFPSSVRRSSYSDHDDRLVQFCHGGPGIVMSLSCIVPCFPTDLQDKMQAVMERARADIWNRGLLTKPPCLCHGIVGNALAFTEPDDARFEQVLAYASTEGLGGNVKADPARGIDKGWLQDAGRDDKFAGLYTGEAGRAWAWAVADKKLPRTCIGYNDV
ncbi:hypothetical protein SLS62_008114 [Diatrype stigma]|uniref:Lanthionine synthetase C-like protein 1 n=1 Tax=Diatrype stigma TaxID=117547 RepID=A0AAN9YQ62_9PEZI